MPLNLVLQSIIVYTCVLFSCFGTEETLSTKKYVFYWIYIIMGNYIRFVLYVDDVYIFIPYPMFGDTEFETVNIWIIDNIIEERHLEVPLDSPQVLNYTAE